MELIKRFSKRRIYNLIQNHPYIVYISLFIGTPIIMLASITAALFGFMALISFIII